MSFPYTYKNKIDLLAETGKSAKPSQFVIKELLKNAILKKQMMIVDESHSSISFEAISEIFKFKYSVDIQIEKTNNDLSVHYQINLSKLINITLAVIIMIAFLSVFSVKYFFIFAGIFSVFFYYLNILIIYTQLSNIIKGSIGENLYEYDNKEIITAEQEKWMNDPGLCPACGEFITAFDQNCPDCGLKIKQKNHILPINVSKYNDKKISYHYRKKKDQP